MNCPNCKTEMRLVGHIAECERWHCASCYYWFPLSDEQVKKWKKDMKRNAALVASGGMSGWIPALKQEHFL